MHSIKPARFSHRLKWVAPVSKPFSLFLLSVVRTYQYLISPLLPPACRYAPTCSEYACEAIHLHGPVKGTLLTGKRLLRCHPWGGSGVDPVPSLSVKKKVRSL